MQEDNGRRTLAQGMSRWLFRSKTSLFLEEAKARLYGQAISAPFGAASAGSSNIENCALDLDIVPRCTSSIHRS